MKLINMKININMKGNKYVNKRMWLFLNSTTHEVQILFIGTNSMASAWMFLNISSNSVLNVLRFCEACNGYYFHFLASLVKTIFASHHLKVSLPMLLKCFLIFA